MIKTADVCVAEAYNCGDVYSQALAQLTVITGKSHNIGPIGYTMATIQNTKRGS